MSPDYSSLVPLDYTYVLCKQRIPVTTNDPNIHPVDDPSTPIAPLLALLTLSPFFLFSSYATIILINRPLSGLNILLGQLTNEVFNGVLKRRLRGVRPGALGEGYGMPSSHSQVSMPSPHLISAKRSCSLQFLGYSSTFLITHLLLIHQRQPGTGRPLPVRNTTTARVTRYGLIFGLVSWSLLTGYSRVYLHYHTAPQVM